MSDQERRERLLVHRELEFLRSAGKAGRKKQPPAQVAKARQRARERAAKLNEAERIARKKKA